jgi:hypothetical protein
LTKRVQTRADLRYRELEAKLGPIIMVEHWPEGVFLQWLALLPYANPYLGVMTQVSMSDTFK